MLRGQSRRGKSEGAESEGVNLHNKLKLQHQECTCRIFGVVISRKFVITNFQNRNYELTHNYLRS
jgi:hypothetical protein